MSRCGWISRCPWSLSLLSVLALGMATPGCLGERRPASERRQGAPAEARLILPTEVDGSLDAMIEGERILAVYDDEDPVRGATAPLVTIVEYSDFQCPYCGTLAESLDELMRDYGQDVRLVFKQYPLPIHSQAVPAARAALAAQAQGKFWEMHDRLFENRKALSDGQLERHARELGLDVERWRQDFMSDALAKHVGEEQSQGSKLGVKGTPTFFINGRRHSGAMSVEQIRSIVDGELLAARQLLEAGAAREELYARFLHPAVTDDDPLAEAKPAQPTPRQDASQKAVPKEALAPAPTPTAVERFAIPTGTDRPQRGPDDALVTIVEFGTFGCESCAELQRTLDQLLARNPEDVRLVFRSLARSAADRRAAHIALSAHRQGEFWKAHGALLEHDGDFTAESASAFAEELGLDVKAFEADLRSREAAGPNTLVRDDLAVLDALGRRDTAPLLFVNGRPVEGAPDLATLEAMLREEKAVATAFLEAHPSTKRAGLYDAMRRTWAERESLDSIARAPARPAGP